MCKVVDGWIWDCDVEVESRAGVVSVVHEEWGYLGSRVWSIVVCEFCDWKEVDPIVLLIARVHSQVRFQRLVGPLCLPVCLWVVCGRKVELDVQKRTEQSRELRRECGSSIGHNIGREPML